MTMKSNKLSLLIVIILFVAVILIIKVREINLNKHGILLNAKTTEWVTGSKMSMDLRYEFYYNGKKIIDNNATGNFRGNRNFEDKYFPVMYDSELGMSQLLITPADFEKYNIPFPDSLKWVLPYLK